MGNILIGLKKFLQNKNIVTILGVVISIAILSFAYTIRVRNSINPVTVPYAKQLIPSATQIKEVMVGTTKVPPSMLVGDVIRTKGEVTDKYTALDAVIPEGSLFYKRAVVDRDSLPDNIILDLKKGEQLFIKTVTKKETEGNLITPGCFVDIYVIVNNYTQNTVARGKLISNVQILAVKDSHGLPVFGNTNTEEELQASTVVFALPEEYFKLLTVASRLQDVTDGVNKYKVEVNIRQNFTSLSDNVGDTELTSEMLKDFINRFAIYD